ncbi:unnamed protein product [Boreogadus saida]
MKKMLVFSALYALVVLFVSIAAEPKTKNCNDVRAAYSSKGFNINDVPNKGVQGPCSLWPTLEDMVLGV